MSPEEMRIAIERQIWAWETLDAELLAAGFAADGEIVTPGKHIRGHAALKETVTHFAAGHRNVSIALQRIVYGHDCAAVQYRWEDTQIEGGERYVADDAVWVDFRGGLITLWREYPDEKSPSTGS